MVIQPRLIRACSPSKRFSASPNGPYDLDLLIAHQLLQSSQVQNHRGQDEEIYSDPVKISIALVNPEPIYSLPLLEKEEGSLR
jgi:hypothetical protein